MVLQTLESPDDFNDPDGAFEDDFPFRHLTEDSWNPFFPAFVGSEYNAGRVAEAPMGQPYMPELPNVLPSASASQYYSNGHLVHSGSSGYHTTPYSSQLPSFHSGPTSEGTSLDDLSTENRVIHQGQWNDLPQSQNNLHSQDQLLKGIEVRHLGQSIAENLEEDLPEDVFAPSSHSGNTIVPTSRPEPDSQREPVQGSTGTSSQEVDNLDSDIDRLEADVMQLLTQNPSFQRLSHSRKRLGAVLEKVDVFLNACGTNTDHEDDKSKATKAEYHYFCALCTMDTASSHVLKRHVGDIHYPEWEFRCQAVENCVKKAPRRRDKVPEHYRVHHNGYPAPGDVIDRSMEPLPCESVCALCGVMVQDWKQFFDCFVGHCKKKLASLPTGSSQRDDNDRASKKRKYDPDQDPSGGGAGAGGSASSRQGYARTGHGTGQGQQQYHFGQSGNQMHSGDSRPLLLQQRSAPDGRDGRMNRSQAKAVDPPTFIAPPSDSGGGSGSSAKRPSKKKGNQPRLDPRDLQGQAPAQPPANKCKSCPHLFHTCLECCNNPPSGDWCHECPNRKRARVRQASNPNANPMSGDYPIDYPIDTELMGFPQQAQYNHRGFHDAGLNAPITSPVNPAYAARQQQRRQQLNQLQRQRAQAQGMARNGYAPLGFFGGTPSYTANAVHDVHVRGMSELEIETSILSSKSKSDRKNAQESKCWSSNLPFRGTSPSLRKALLGMTSIPAEAMGNITRRFIGPVPLTQVNPSSVCQCACRTKSEGTYFARGRVDIAGGRRIELNFKMAPEARGAAHPLRTRIQVVVKMLRLRSSATRSASAKHKQEARDAIKKVLEATLNSSETPIITHEDETIADLDNSDYDSDADSVAESIFSSSSSRASSYADLAPLSPPSSLPTWTSSRASNCTELSLPLPHSSPELSAYPSKLSCSDLNLPASSPFNLPFRQNWNDDTVAGEEHPVHGVEVYEEEEKELELTFDFDLKSSLDMLARWTGVPTDDLRSSVSVWDPDRVFRYIMNHLLFVIFSLARSRDNDTNPCWDMKRPSQS
ncbi:hypothetical protein F1880_009157 [Penicillium rolfsii]|nr:hypothetical protein F1880_009157 [Penicillium rolfsii]